MIDMKKGTVAAQPPPSATRGRLPRRCERRREPRRLPQQGGPAGSAATRRAQEFSRAKCAGAACLQHEAAGLASAGRCARRRQRTAMRHLPSRAPLSLRAALALSAVTNSTKAILELCCASPRSLILPTGPARHVSGAGLSSAGNKQCTNQPGSLRVAPSLLAYRTGSRKSPGAAHAPPPGQCCPRRLFAPPTHVPRGCAAGSCCSRALWRSWRGSHGLGTPPAHCPF